MTLLPGSMLLRHAPARARRHMMPRHRCHCSGRTQQERSAKLIKFITTAFRFNSAYIPQADAAVPRGEKCRVKQVPSVGSFSYDCRLRYNICASISYFAESARAYDIGATYEPGRYAATDISTPPLDIFRLFLLFLTYMITSLSESS